MKTKTALCLGSLVLIAVGSYAGEIMPSLEDLAIIDLQIAQSLEAEAMKITGGDEQAQWFKAGEILRQRAKDEAHITPIPESMRRDYLLDTGFALWKYGACRITSCPFSELSARPFLARV